MGQLLAVFAQSQFRSAGSSPLNGSAREPGCAQAPAAAGPSPGHCSPRVAHPRRDTASHPDRAARTGRGSRRNGLVFSHLQPAARPSPRALNSKQKRGLPLPPPPRCASTQVPAAGSHTLGALRVGKAQARGQRSRAASRNSSSKAPLHKPCWWPVWKAAGDGQGTAAPPLCHLA